MSRTRFYLDHAATSWPKPPGSLEAAVAYQTDLGVAIGRGIYTSAQSADKLLWEARDAVARLVHASSGADIFFTANGTHAIHATLFGWLDTPAMRGAHVVTTAIEHNSVLRPLALLATRNAIRTTRVDCDADGYVDPSAVREAIGAQTRLVIVNHASNVTGAIQDIAAMADVCRLQKLPLMIDAAQTLGYQPIDVQALGIGILVAPGHKGCGGMLGTGIAYVHPSFASQMAPVWIGGTGTHSESIDGPFDWTSTVESGNINMPAIASLRAGIHWINKELHLSSDRGSKVRATMDGWVDRLLQAVGTYPSLRLVGPAGVDWRVPVVSLTSSRSSCHEMAILLDGALGVEARSGLHCAGAIHACIDTLKHSGTLRLSLGHTTTEQDIEAAIAGIELLGSL